MRRLAAALLAVSLVPAAAAAAAADEDKDAPKDPPGVVTMTQEQQRAMKLGTAPVERRAITEPVRVPAVVAFDPGRVAMIRALAPARVTQVLVQPGDPVAAGQTLARLEIPSLVDAQARLASARSQVREADAEVAVARDALRRGETLARDGSLSRAEAERRRLTLAQADAAAASARNQEAALRTQVGQLNPQGGPGAAALASPIAGIVVSVGLAPGEFVDPGASGFTVADLSVVVVMAQAPEASAAMIAVGDPVRVRLTAGGGRTWASRVAALGAALDPQARTLPVRLTLDNADGALRAGMFVEAVITSDRDRSDLVVPASAVQFVGDKRVAFTPLGPDRFQSHELSLGVERTDWVEVRKGLDADAKVVTQGSFELKSLLQQQMLDGG